MPLLCYLVSSRIRQQLKLEDDGLWIFDIIMTSFYSKIPFGSKFVIQWNKAYFYHCDIDTQWCQCSNFKLRGTSCQLSTWYTMEVRTMRNWYIEFKGIGNTTDCILYYQYKNFNCWSWMPIDRWSKISLIIGIHFIILFTFSG